MKKLIVILLCIILFVGCTQNTVETEPVVGTVLTFENYNGRGQINVKWKNNTDSDILLAENATFRTLVDGVWQKVCAVECAKDTVIGANDEVEIHYTMNVYPFSTNGRCAIFAESGESTYIAEFSATKPAPPTNSPYRSNVRREKYEETYSMLKDLTVTDLRGEDSGHRIEILELVTEAFPDNGTLINIPIDIKLNFYNDTDEMWGVHHNDWAFFYVDTEGNPHIFKKTSFRYQEDIAPHSSKLLGFDMCPFSYDVNFKVEGLEEGVYYYAVSHFLISFTITEDLAGANFPRAQRNQENIFEDDYWR